MNNFNWSNRPLEKRFNSFHELVKRGWRIELERIEPIPNQNINRFGDIPLVTWSTYVYPPNSDEWIMELNASFDSPMEAYEWIAPRIERYANED